MPRKGIANYIFYKIYCDDEKIKSCYIGTTTSFDERKRAHNYNVNNNYDNKVYNFIRENGGWENWSMIVIAEQNNLSYIQALEIEQNFIKELNADLNTNININVNRNSYSYIKAQEWNKKNKEARKIIQLRHRAKKLGLPFLEVNEAIQKKEDLEVNETIQKKEDLEVNEAIQKKDDFEFYLKNKKEFEEYKEFLQNKNLFDEFKLLKMNSLANNTIRKI
jgi:hypothetical protein